MAFGCPQHKGGAKRQPYAGSGANFSEGPPPGETRWNMYTDGDERELATAAVRSINR